MRSQIDLRRLRYVAEVARAESITTAAQTLDLTQPALTRSIAEVESELGTKLFERLPRGVRPTAAGERFLIRARKLIVDMDDLVADTRNRTQAMQGRLRIGAAPSANLIPALSSLSQLAKQNPELNIETIDGSTQDLCPKMLRGEIDMVIGSTRYFRHWRELSVQNLRTFVFGCMVRQGHPLSELDVVKEIDILRYPLILPTSVEPIFTDIIARYAHNDLHPPQPQYTTDNFELAKTLINHSDAYYPLHFPSPNFGGLREQFLIIEDTVKMPTNHLGIATATRLPKSEQAATFEQLLIDRLIRTNPAAVPL